MLCIPGPRAEFTTEPSFESGDNRLNLPSLAISLFKESFSHLPAVFCFWPPLASLMPFGWDYAESNSILFSTKLVDLFGVIAFVSQERIKVKIIARLGQKLRHSRVICAGTQSNRSPYEEVGFRFAEEIRFGVLAHGEWSLASAFHIVSTRVARFHSCGVSDCNPSKISSYSS